VHIYSKLIGDNLVTVVGEVPPKTVIQVADSVRYAGE
jgi:negative regulator of sigma E activity